LSEKDKQTKETETQYKSKQKNRTKIISALDQNGSRVKPLRKPERSDVDEALLKWFKQERSDSAAVDGPFVMITSVLPKL